MVIYLFSEYFTTNFLHTHTWLNWVDEDDWWGWGWLERKARRHKIHQKDYIKIRHEAPGVRAKELDPNFCHYWDCRLGKVQVCHAWRHPVGVWNVLARWRLQPGLKLWFPTDTRRRFSKFLNLNGWTAFCIPGYNFLIMVPRARQRGANCPLSLCPCFNG